MSIFGVIADDLTGAMDAGVQMQNRDKRVRVALSTQGLDDLIEDTDFVVVNTQSRNISPDVAYQRVTTAVKQFLKNDCRIFYKKIDSTLRGNIGAELQAILDSADFDCVLVAPALPFNKRTTENGVHFVGGKKLAEIELAKDPFAPIYISSIAGIIKEQFNKETGLINLEIVRQGSFQISQAINKYVANGTKIIVVDAVEDEDLLSIAKAVALFKGNTMLCGSAGLFQFFDQAYDIRATNNVGPEFVSANHTSPVLTVSGSPAEMSKKQIHYLTAKRQDIFSITLDVTNGQVGDAIKGVQEKVIQNLQRGKHVILDAAGESKEAILQKTQGNREKLDYHSLLVQRLISEVAYAAVSNLSLTALIIFGGDTAVSVIDRLGAKGIEIMGQVEPYIPCGNLIGGGFSGLLVVTKAGGFGKKDSLEKILNKFRKRAMFCE